MPPFSRNGSAADRLDLGTGGARAAPELLDRILDEVSGGLQSEVTKGRMDRAQKARDFYNFDGQRHWDEFANDAETPIDYIARKYRESGFTREAVDVLCEHVYAPGPDRTWDDGPAVDEFLERVYRDVHINAKMQRAESLSTLMDVAAIQIDAGTGTFDDHPIRLHLWGADEFEIWEDANDRLEVVAVCTRDKYDLQRRFRLWTIDEVYTYVTRKAEGTAGGRVAEPVGPPQPNPYGMIPFVFVHYSLPQCDFWEPGIGNLLVNGELRMNDRLSRIEQSIHKHLNPIPIAKDVPDGFQVIIQPNMFLRLNRRAVAPGADGAFGGAGPPEPELSYLQANIDVDGSWRDLEGYAGMLLEAARIPRSAVRMEQTGIASGIALLVEQAPLITRAKQRRPMFNVYEETLGRAIATCAGNYYRRRELVAQAKAGRQILAWPMPSIPVQTDDWLNLQLMREQAGLTSKIQITMAEYDCGRETAIKILEQVAEDRTEEEKILPPLEVASGEL